MTLAVFGQNQEVLDLTGFRAQEVFAENEGLLGSGVLGFPLCQQKVGGFQSFLNIPKFHLT